MKPSAVACASAVSESATIERTLPNTLRGAAAASLGPLSPK